MAKSGRNLTVLTHPLATHWLSVLRDRRTRPQAFRAAAERLTEFLFWEASRDLCTLSIPVITPLEKTSGWRVSDKPVVIPVLRAGLSMLSVFTDLLPEADVGYIGLARDETTAVANKYYEKFPPLKGRRVFVLDPMLATGGSAAHALELVLAKQPGPVTFVCVVAAPEGVKRLKKDCPSVGIVTAALDRKLNAKKYILPGLGDFGDRLYGTE
jgi:uracil phosphoribosyltransferase